MSISAQNERIKKGWESRRGEPPKPLGTRPPAFVGHPKIANEFSKSRIYFALRVFHNREKEYYKTANELLKENCKFYIEHHDVRDDRDSFYWSVVNLCNIFIHFGQKGTEKAGLVTPDTEEWFLAMAYSYVHDLSKVADAEYVKSRTWNVTESENHHVQKNSTMWLLLYALLTHDEYKNRTLADGFTGEQHLKAWGEFFMHWMAERVAHSFFIEVLSREYANHTIKNIYPLYDYGDEKLKAQAEKFINLFWAKWAEEQGNSNLGGGQARVYSDRSAFLSKSELADFSWYYCGVGHFRKPESNDWTIIDSSYRMPEWIEDMIKSHRERGSYEVEMRPLGLARSDDKPCDYRPRRDWGGIYRYSKCTPYYNMGTLMFEQLPKDKWCLISSQNRCQGIDFYAERDMKIVPLPEAGDMHSLDMKAADVCYNSFWSMQKDSTLITQKCKYCTDAKNMRIWFSRAGGLENFREKNGWLICETEDSFAAVKIVSGGYTEKKVDEQELSLPDYLKLRGTFAVCDEEFTPVILEAATKEQFHTVSEFENALFSAKLSWKKGVLTYRSIHGHTFVFDSSCGKNCTIDGEYYVKRPKWSSYSPFIKIKWGSPVAEITWRGEKRVYNFEP